MTTTPRRILADDSSCGGCNNGGQCILPAISSLSTNFDNLPTTLGGHASCDCKGTGYLGEHCDIPCTLDCQNGGKCLPAVENVIGERCSCSKAVVDGEPYAGLTCEYAATKSCMMLGTESKHSFCTNGGECQNFVGDNQMHEDCICLMGFEGPHCEYVTVVEKASIPDYAPDAPVSAPKEEGGLATGGGKYNDVSAVKNSNGAYHPKQTTASDTVVFIMIIVVSALIGVLLLAFGVRARKRRKNALRRASEEANEELSMIPNHNRPGENEII
eukprot:CAMPEP_0183705344 /NCGR_PEP_ID=MMETSP0737-20130205/2471_1 /TAXON_ID=385413 /ORGANISM="Thalassiosira miniscula, Strain CCMP1093" /LENGTH=271 /DNA_ID=CAMNT_0025932481 /DNA_START=114 /DNA_END=929 /DNA_ORIENTATION=+